VCTAYGENYGWATNLGLLLEVLSTYGWDGRVCILRTGITWGKHVISMMQQLYGVVRILN
jgi:hypothetical protein